MKKLQTHQVRKNVSKITKRGIKVRGQWSEMNNNMVPTPVDQTIRSTTMPHILKDCLTHFSIAQE
jgi:hypothetical protein